MFNQTRNSKINDLTVEDRAYHDWYRFVLSFPPHLVRHYLDQFGANAGSMVLDPFCGTGTTLVESKKLGIASVGCEANPVTHFASTVKLNWQIDPVSLIDHAEGIATRVQEVLSKEGFNEVFLLSSEQAEAFSKSADLQNLPESAWKIMLKNAISPVPLHKVLLLRQAIDRDAHPDFRALERLALADIALREASNLHFAPEVSVGRIKHDAWVIEPWLDKIRTMAADLHHLQDHAQVRSYVHHADARLLDEVLAPESIDIVFTSPPYPNEKDYTRITRLEMVLLGFAVDKPSLRALKNNLLRSNTRNIYKDDSDDQWVSRYARIQVLASAIEDRRIALGKTSGFEKLYARATKLYFGGMARHLAALRPLLRPNAYLGYVVGDQASYLQVMIRTGEILAEIADDLGYEVVTIDLFRTRLATATKEQLREEVVVLRWRGN